MATMLHHCVILESVHNLVTTIHDIAKSSLNALD
uniref:Uncharacterized protein n=1 Tax=Parascaris equorum TaxID=6256 RepID=A0A914RHV2_PAREQ